MPAPNIICLVVDRLQAGMLGPYGNAWVRTPQVDRLAASGRVFDQAYACDPSLDAVLSALWNDRERLPFMLLTDDPFVYGSKLADGIAERLLVDLPSEVADSTADIAETQLAQFFVAAADWLATAREPFSLWLHTRGMAGPWDAPRELREQFADEEDPVPPDFTAPPNRVLPDDFDPDELLGIVHAYAGQISLFDTCLGVFLDAFDESPRAADTLLVLVGARGFPLGEHRRVGDCDAALYNELTHVPLIVRAPDQTGRLLRSQSLVTHADLPRLLHGESPPERDHLIFRSQRDRAVRTPAWLLRESNLGEVPHRELYVKPDDRWEANDIADRCPEIVDQLSAVLATPPTALDAKLPDTLVTTVE